MTRSWCLTFGRGRPFGTQSDGNTGPWLCSWPESPIAPRPWNSGSFRAGRLVGPYLDHLPGDGSDELNDGEAPTVRDEKAPAAAANPG